MTATNEHTNGCSIQIGDSAPVAARDFELVTARERVTSESADDIRARWIRQMCAKNATVVLSAGMNVEPLLTAPDGPIRDLYVAAWWLLSRLDRGWQPSQIEREIATLRRAVNAVNAADPDGIGR